jgi:heme-degrading monooxygenase HmoA
MIVEYIRYRIPDDEAQSFEAAYRRAGASLEASPHRERYEVARCTEDPGAYTVRIEWDSAEGHPEGFRSRPEFRTFFAAVRSHVDRIEEMRHYDVKARSVRMATAGWAWSRSRARQTSLGGSGRTAGAGRHRTSAAETRQACAATGVGPSVAD